MRKLFQRENARLFHFQDEVTPFNNQDEVPLSKVKNHHGQIIWTRGYLKVPLRLGYYPTGSTEKRYAGVLYDDSDKNLRVEVVINNDNEMLKRFFELDEVLVRGKVFIKGEGDEIGLKNETLNFRECTQYFRRNLR